MLTPIFVLILCIQCFADPTPVGTNLDGVADFSRTLPFVDLVKQCRKFGTPNTPWDGNCKVDSVGWPTEDFGVILADEQLDISGVTLSLSGECNAQPTIKNVASNVQIQNLKWDSTSHTVTASLVVGPQETQVMLGFTGTSGGCRNLTVLLPGYRENDIFTTPWITMLQKFEVLRFMDWGSTNNNPVVNWADRNTMDHPSWAYGRIGNSGVPWEVCIDLINQLGKDMWINIPHQATDDYVSQFAQLLKQRLNPTSNIYIEYSNEVWNWQFSQATWNLNTAVDEVQNHGDPNKLNYDNCNNKYYWGWRRVPARLKQITEIFAKVWGESEINGRLRPVLAGQVANPFVVQLGLRYMEDVWGMPKKWFYAIAGAPYFNLGSTNNNPNMTKDDVLNALKKSIDSMDPKIGVGQDNALAAHAQFSKWYGLEMRGYEGGPDTFGPNGIQAKSDATMDPMMKTLVISYLNIWVSYGFSPLNWFTAGADSYNSQYGTWALTDDMKNFNVPKIQGIDYVRTNSPAPLAVGIAVPATLNATEYVGHSVPIKDPYLANIGINSTFYYIVRTPSARMFSVTVWTSGNKSGQLAINVNNSGDQSVTTPITNTFKPCPSVSFLLDAGVNVLRLLALSDRTYNIQQIQVN